jgi:hypothetical protein
MISPDLIITLLIGSLCCVVGFVAYWRGVHATEQRLKPRLAAQQAQIEQILDDLDECVVLLHEYARERHPAGRALRVVTSDSAS